MKKCALIIYLFLALVQLGGSQDALIEGYVFEDGSPNYLEGVKLTIVDDSTGNEITKVFSELDGYFKFFINQNKRCRIIATSKYFQENLLTFDVGKEAKTFLRIGMTRKEGYLMTLSIEKQTSRNSNSVMPLLGAKVSVFNNSQQVLVYESKYLGSSSFSIPIVSDNHYSITLEKPGFLIKQIEAFVDKDGCVLCFEGIDKVQLIPKDSIMLGLSKGVLIANVELVAASPGQVLPLSKVKFDKGSTKLSTQAVAKLPDFAAYIKSNKEIQFEIASYTDARGRPSENLKETSEQAKNVHDYLIEILGVDSRQLSYKGYGSSNLLNNCQKDIKCSEEEHSENRRLVARIVNIGQKISQDVAVGEGEYLKDEKEEEVKTRSDTSNIKTIVEDADRLSKKPKKELNDEKIDSTYLIESKEESSQVLGREEALIEIVQLAEALKEDNNGSISNALDLPIADSLKSEQVLEERSFLEKQNEERDRIEDKIDFREIDLMNAQPIVDESSLFYDFSGYKIVIYFSNFPISADHEIYDRYEDIRSFRTRENNILYLVGEFESIKGANEALEGIKKKDSRAYIVRLLNGKKINLEE